MSNKKESNCNKYCKDGGRPRRPKYEELGFEYIKHEKSYTARYTYCNIVLKNTINIHISTYKYNNNINIQKLYCEFIQCAHVFCVLGLTCDTHGFLSVFD